MKKIDFIKELSELTKIQPDRLKEYFTNDEEVDIEFEKPHVFSEAELDTLKENVRKSAAKATMEMYLKGERKWIVDNYGEEFSFEGVHSDNLKTALINIGKKEAGVKPNEQLVEKEKVIKALQESVQQLETEKVQIVNEKNQILMDYEINSTITKAIPSDLETIWTSDEIAELWKKNYQIVIEDGKKMVKKGGEILRDKKTQDPLPVDVVVGSWLLEKGVSKKTAQGRGAGDSKEKSDRSEFKSVEEIVTYAEEKKLTNEQQVELTRKFFKDNPNSGM